MSPKLAAIVSLRNLIIGVNVAAVVFLIGVGLAALRERRRRTATPPNQDEYLDDTAMEGPRLERMLGWALAMFALIAVSLPLYWLVEPTRQSAMDDQFLETAVEQGAELFGPTPGESELALGCANCHGTNGEGGFAVTSVEIPKDELRVADGALQAQDRKCAPVEDDDSVLLCQVNWEAPALNTVFQRFSRDEVFDIITFGRPGTPMPAWGVEGGGPKNEQSIDDIVDFLESIQLEPEEARSQNADVSDGQTLFETSCARCHTKHWAYRQTFSDDPSVDLLSVPGGGAFGPNLTGGVVVRQFPEIADHIEFVIQGSDFQMAYGTRGIGSGRMPGFGGLLTADQIRAIVEYERGLQESEPVVIDEPGRPPSAEGPGGQSGDTSGSSGGAATGGSGDEDAGIEGPGGDDSGDEGGTTP